MPFLSHLDTRAYRPDEFMLRDRFGFEFELSGVRYQLWTPERFITDFGSMPWLVQAIPGFDVNGPSRFASIPHDYLYSCHGSVSVVLLNQASGVPIGFIRKQFTRAECDEIFRLAILDIGGDPYTRIAVNRRYTKAEAAMFYAGVRAGGWYYWNKRAGGLRLGYDLAPPDTP